MTDLSQRLADVHTSSIMFFVIGLTVIRLLLVKRQSGFARAVVEIADAALFASVLMFMIVLPFVVKSFYIPSGSMRPTLVDDDHILVNKFLYRMHSPNHGDVVVFTAPPQALESAAEKPDADGAPTDYIKRLIGLPGDIIEVHAGYILVGPLNGQEMKSHDDVREALQILDADRQHVISFGPHRTLATGALRLDPHLQKRILPPSWVSLGSPLKYSQATSCATASNSMRRIRRKIPITI